ncbi:sel1 repeat family protein [Methylobrevis sp. L22]|uniref:Sel1 repeat family protein n=1 Tax=Methylobrevis albus TaxID=2793297 RepID=A0A931I6C4_9HYPH|nr:sel1 repeat family protein [Methylobrevis albus]
MVAGSVSVGRKFGIAVIVGLVASAPAYAFDVKSVPDGAWSEQQVDEAFRDGTRAYFSGDKVAALDGLMAAAKNGHPAAKWKLGRMYSRGDGVDENDLQAFEYFSEIVAEHADDSPQSPQAPFIASAFVEIGSYYRTGIENSTIRANDRRAREIFTYAASYFGDATAQLKLAEMYLTGSGGEQDPRQAARWLQLAAKKGQLKAQVRLGELLTLGTEIEPSPVHGLMWLTVAMKRARALGVPDAEIRDLHEQAFSLASEDVRRRAMTMASRWLEDNQESTAVAAQ